MIQDSKHFDFPSTTSVDDFWFSPYVAACTTVAIELGVFDRLSLSPESSKDLSKDLELKDHFILDRVCRVLVSVGSLNFNGRKFSLTSVSSTYWVSTSRFFRGNSFKSRESWTIHGRVRSAMLNGWEPARDGEFPVQQQWRKGILSSRAASKVATSMHQMMLAVAAVVARTELLSGRKNLLDLGGGIGTFALEFATIQPELRSKVFDLPVLQPLAEKYIEQMRLSDRVEFLGGSFFDSDSKGFSEDEKLFDSIWISNVLHDWQHSEVTQILKRAFQSLEVGGVLFINEMLLNENRVSPTAAVAFDLMIAMTHQGQQFTFNELQRLLSEVGFKEIVPASEFGYYKIVRATKKDSSPIDSLESTNEKAK